MTALPRPAEQDFYTTMREMSWSATEKLVARKAFDRALQRELGALMQSAKLMAANIQQPSELWELERHLTQVRKEIDRKYEYKYSTLLLLFADLVREGKLNTEDLRGLAEDKVRFVRRYAGRSVA